MFGHDFYHETIRRYSVLFGTVFNDIYISRTDNANNTVNTMKVPISYAAKDKAIERLKADPALDRSASIVLPFMSFEIEGIEYDNDRKLNSTGRSPYLNANSNIANYVYNPVPYNFMFDLTIITKTIEDGHKIIEQILPYFTPDWTVSIKIIDDPVIIKDIPIILNGAVKSDNFSGHLTEDRYITWTFKFTLKGYLFGPISTSKIIKQAIVNTIAGANNGFVSAANGVTTRLIDERITTQPGLTANGQPTTNLALSIPYSQINWNNNFDYITTIQLGLYANN